MTKSYQNSQRKPSSAFTLLELLVVIAIIGVLAALMFPATNGVIRKAERTHAQNTAYNLKTGISAYFTEYRKYPADAGTQEGSGIRTDEQLMDPLLGADTDEGKRLNPRRIAFYTDKAAKPRGNGNYVKGLLLDQNGGGSLWDPWGDDDGFKNYYFVDMDLDYNNRTMRPTWDRGTPDELSETILIWSAGKDNEETTPLDNIKTW